MIDQKKIQTMCLWVQERISDEFIENVEANELHLTFTALATVAGYAQSTFLIPDLFPGINLSVLYIHNVDGPTSKGVLSNSATTLVPGLSVRALSAIGHAFSNELQKTGCDMFSWEYDGAEIIVYAPHVQSLVLQATGTTLLTQPR